MYIKQIVIKGFKSYKDQVIVDPFDPKHNVVVGRNGSGKSNLFSAFEFVLSDDYSHLSTEKRQALLHEGTGARAISAYVEMVFDNSDGRLPIPKDEVFLRRNIGLKTDQYLLNKAISPRSEIMNLLESAGFSRANPYYIVKQGKIMQLATQRDSERLNLLREVAGTRVYDEQKEKSKAILLETESKREKYEELLNTISDRMSTLEEEKEELKAYQKYDKMRRGLQFTITERELEETKQKLVDMESKRKNSGEEAEELRKKLQEAQEAAETFNKEVKDIRLKETAVKEERDSLNSEQQQQTKEKTRLEFVIKDLQDTVEDDNHSKEKSEHELQKLNDTIEIKEKELGTLKPRYEEMRKKEDDYTRELELKEQKRKELYQKQGRGSQFTSKEQRDEWIKVQLKDYNKQIKEKVNQIEKLNRDITNDTDRKEKLETEIEKSSGDLENFQSRIDDESRGFYELKRKKDDLQSQRNDLCREETNLQHTLSNLKGDIGKSEQILLGMGGKPTMNGRDSVKKVLQIFREKGEKNGVNWDQMADSYYGMVIENFTCDDSIFTAVETTAGGNLFRHIAETDIVGMEILKEMNRQHLPGEVSFMPLNRLKKPHAGDLTQTKDNIPMISKINFDKKYEHVMRHIFGKTMICRSLEIATKLSRELGVKCVTLGGDLVQPGGPLTGGYIDKSRSALDAQRNKTTKGKEYQEKCERMRELKAELTSIEKEIRKVVSKMQDSENKNSKGKDVYEKLTGDIKFMKEEVTALEQNLSSKDRSLSQFKGNLESMETTKASLEAELKQELLATLSSADQQEVEKLNSDIKKLKQDNKMAFADRMRLEAQKNKLENLLNNNLKRRKDELVQALQEISVEDRKRQLENTTSELQILEKRNSATKETLKTAEKKLEDLQRRRKKVQAELEDARLKQREITDKIEEDKKDLERMQTKQNNYNAKISECNKTINELGSLPTDAYTKYNDMSQKQLFKQLDKAQLELKKYSHVNKKALDQFISFSEEKIKLQKRKEEQDRSHAKILDLMKVLEQRKLDEILHTFNQVQKHFREVFKKLVPSGNATLSIKGDTDDDSSDKSQAAKNFEKATGISCSVSFSGKNGEMREMAQLSGGQKSLVALALIFAIQKSDPAPFYLFDEIDAALDPQYRRAVADMIHELSREAQFITTTFRPELLQHASRFYGVIFRNKVSHIELVSKEKANDFVEDDAAQM